jgi:hypothetical protein
MPAIINHTASIGVPSLSGPRSVRSFSDGNEPYYQERNYTLSGVTRDATGAALGSCTVSLFNSATNIQEQNTTSDASGNYSFIVDKTQTWYVVAYKAGGTPVAGTTLNTLAGA